MEEDHYPDALARLIHLGDKVGVADLRDGAVPRVRGFELLESQRAQPLELVTALVASLRVVWHQVGRGGLQLRERRAGRLRLFEFGQVADAALRVVPVGLRLVALLGVLA